MNRVLVALAGSMVVLVSLLFILARDDSRGHALVENDNAISERSSREPIVLFCAASNRAVIESIRLAYEEEFGASIQVQYGPSQTLLSSIEVSGVGDLYLPADDSYIELGIEKSLVAEVLPLATMRAVVAVPRGNPKAINAFDDLLRTDVRVIQANPDMAAIGKVVKRATFESGNWDRLANATVAYRTNVNDVANDIMIGAADAGLVYDAVLTAYPDLEAVSMETFSSAISNVSLAVIKSSKQPQAALHFARYIAARDRGLVHYGKFGFVVKHGDAWAETPELTIFAGSMLSPAIETMIKSFEEREGVRVSRVYNANQSQADSPYPQTAGRLLLHLCSTESQETVESLGFRLSIQGIPSRNQTVDENGQ